MIKHDMLQGAHALDVVTYGEAMAMFVAEETGDLAAVAHFMRRLAGAETNVAIGLARLGLKVGWMSRVGDDSFGRFIRASVQAEGVDCSRVVTVAGQTSAFQLKALAEHGADPLVEYFRKGSAASRLTPEHFDPAYFLSARHLHATGVAAALSATSLAFAGQALDFMREHGRTTSPAIICSRACGWWSSSWAPTAPITARPRATAAWCRRRLCGRPGQRLAGRLAAGAGGRARQPGRRFRHPGGRRHGRFADPRPARCAGPILN